MTPAAVRPVLAAVALGSLLGCTAPPPRHDTVVRNATVVDGTGAAPFVADVAFRDGRIVEVTAKATARGRREIDGEGLVMAPGFIDLHSHADLIVLGNPEVEQRLLEAKIRQGVTTIVVGNCGLGTAPATSEATAILAEVNGWMTPDAVAAVPGTTADYLDRVEQGGVVVNVATLVPHGPLRVSAMGVGDGPAPPAALDAMRRALDAALEQGAYGLTFGLIYPPGMFSDTSELKALAEVAARRDRLVAIHVRGSSELLLDATRELIEIARSTRARVHHSHLEAVGERYWPWVHEVLKLEDAARAEGLRVSHDVFPYTRAATMMAALFPPWSLEGGVPALVERLRDPSARARIRESIERQRPEWPPWAEGGWPHNLVRAVGWDAIRVASVGDDAAASIAGKSIEQLASERGQHPFDVVADLMVSHGGRVGQLVGEISGRDERIEALERIVAHPRAAIVSDAEDYGRGVPHPAHAGAFARVLRLRRETAFASIESVIHRMTGYPASLLRLAERGTLTEGAAADAVLFNPETIRDLADWGAPRRHAAGVEFVWINGEPLVDGGRYRPKPAGRVLRAND